MLLRRSTISTKRKNRAWHRNRSRPRRGLTVLPRPKTSRLLRLLVRRWYIPRSRLPAVRHVSGRSTKKRPARGDNLLSGEYGVSSDRRRITMRSPRRVESAMPVFWCEHDAPIAVRKDDQGQRSAHCLKCGTSGPLRRDALTARSALVRGKQI